MGQVIRNGHGLGIRSRNSHAPAGAISSARKALKRVPETPYHHMLIGERSLAWNPLPQREFTVDVDNPQEAIALGTCGPRRRGTAIRCRATG